MNVKTRTCIICKKTAKSAEHVFPAALGGRRTNNRIYCGIHNNKFGTYVAELERNLGLMNALVKIRPDRKDVPKSFMFESKEETFSLLGSDIDLISGVLPDYPAEAGEFNYQFVSTQDREKWFKDYPNDGLEIEVKSVREDKEYYTDPIPIQLHFGGPKTMYAVIYLALTFIADNYPDLARIRTLIKFKQNIVRQVLWKKAKKLNNDWLSSVAFWDGRDTDLVVGKSPFEFGHTIAISINSETGQVSCYVSFFSCLNFVIDFGCHELAKSGEFQSKTIFINPEADSAKGGSDKQVFESVSGDILDGIIDLETMIADGNAQKLVENFFEKVSAKKEVSLRADIRDKLSVADLASNKSHRYIIEFFSSFFDEYSQSIVNQTIKLRNANNNVPSIFDDFLNVLIEKGDHSGLSRNFYDFVKSMEFLFATVAIGYLLSGKKDLDYLVYDLLYGWRGKELIILTIRDSLLILNANPRHP